MSTFDALTIVAYGTASVLFVTKYWSLSYRIEKMYFGKAVSEHFTAKIYIIFIFIELIVIVGALLLLITTFSLTSDNFTRS